MKKKLSSKFLTFATSAGVLAASAASAFADADPGAAVQTAITGAGTTMAGYAGAAGAAGITCALVIWGIRAGKKGMRAASS